VSNHAQAAAGEPHEPGTQPDLPPPKSEIGVYGWLYHNLASTPANMAMTLVGLWLLYLLIPPVIAWAFIDADWTGDSREDCSRAGACWVFIKVWLKQLMYGRYPNQELWRINTAYLILGAGIVSLLIPGFRKKHWVGAFLLFVYPVIAHMLFVGGNVLHTVPKWLAFYAIIGGAMVLFNPRFRAREWMRWYRRVVFPVVALALAAFIFFGDTGASARFDAGSGAGNVDAGADTITVPGHVFHQGEEVVYSSHGGNVVAGLEEGDSYRVIVVDERTVKLAASEEDAQAGVAVNLRDAGLGEGHSLTLVPAWPLIETPLWGGLYLTLVIGVVGIVGSLPVGIVLALGRRSEMPIVRSLSIAFIELWRGVPLITVLFMASVMFPLFFPEGVTFDKLARALLGVMLFASAYMAEVVRGGLQAIPKGQFEAAAALGLSYWKSMGLVIMPQALKMTIPGIVNTFIGLFKDTTLVLIIGLFDFLGMAQLAGTNPDWLGFAVEGYVFTAFGFWIFCFGMSRYSQYLERKLHTGH